MSSDNLRLRIRTHRRFFAIIPEVKEKEQEFVNIQDINEVVKRRFRPPSIQASQTYALGTTVTPVIIIQ